MIELRAGRARLLSMALGAVLAIALQGCAHSPTKMGNVHTVNSGPPAYAAPEIEFAPPPPPQPLPAELAPPATDTGPESPGEGPRPVRVASASRPQIAARGDTFAEAAPPAEGPPQERVLCDATGKMEAKSVCDEITAIWNSAKNGKAGVRYPATMVRGETRTVSFAISRARAGDSSVSDILGAPPTDAETTLKVSGQMGAQLVGDGFTIDPPGMVVKGVGLGGNAWEWKITALKAPHHSLKVSAFMIVDAPDGSRRETELRSKDIPIRVNVTPAQSFSDFVASMVSISDSAKVLIGALTALLVALLTFRSKVMELVGPLFGRKASAPQQRA